MGASVHSCYGVGLGEEVLVQQVRAGDTQLHARARPCIRHSSGWPGRVWSSHKQQRRRKKGKRRSKVQLATPTSHVEESMSTFIGRVIGIKMQKTAKVEVCRMFLHPHVLKVSEGQAESQRQGVLERSKIVISVHSSSQEFLCPR